MSLSVVIEILALALALCGLLLQTRRDPNLQPSWRNLSWAGRLILVLLIAIAAFKVVKGNQDAEAARRARAETKKSYDSLLAVNNQLVRVMSVASGYSAQISGVIVFAITPDQDNVEKALENLFLKFAEVEVVASNRLGEFHGRVDYGAHPDVFRFLNLQRIQEDPLLVQLRDRVPASERPRAFFFMIRCGNFKMLNADKVQYARLAPNDP